MTLRHRAVRAAIRTLVLAAALYVFGLLLVWATEHPAIVLALSFAATLAAALRLRHLYLIALAEQQEGPRRDPHRAPAAHHHDTH